MKMLSTSISFLGLLGLCRATVTTFQIPQKLAPGSARLDPAPVAFSFEFPYFPDYLVNITNTLGCLANLKDLTGTWPRIRLGGTTEDQSLFDPTLEVPVLKLSNSSFRYGPEFLKLAASYGGNVVVGLNRGANNLSNTIQAAKTAKALMPNLYAFELGNEPDIFPYLEFPIAPNASNWIPTTEAASEAEWQTAIGKATNSKNIIQAGNFVLPPEYGYSAVQLFANEDPTAIKYIKDFSHHNYPQTVVNTTSIPGPNLTALMSHANIVENVAPYAADTEAARKLGFEYVFGETNSVSGGGSPVISKTFGAGLWVLDYSLRAASSNISRAYFHHGPYTAWFYIWWTPFGVTSPYYGGYAATKAMAGGSYISALDDGTSNYAGYVVYSAAKKPIKIVLINSDYFDGNGTRSTRRFVLEGLSDSRSGHGGKLRRNQYQNSNGNDHCVIKATRLTATSAWSRQDEGDSPTFGGQTFSDSKCQIKGAPIKESVNVVGGKAEVTLKASEALLIEL